MPPRLNSEWELEIQFNPQEIDEPHELYFFLGSVPSAPSNWRTSPSRLFEPITSHQRTTHTEFRDLNGYLEAHSKNKLEDRDVVSYLRENLTWRVKKRYRDETIENSKLKSLKVSVHGPDGEITLSDETPHE